MFSISITEIFLVLLVGALVLNTKDLILIIQWFKRVRQHWMALKYQIEELINYAEKDNK